MKDWRTPEQEEADRRSRPALRLEAWGAGIAMAVVALIMLRALLGW
jgi:hypothetical protein